MKKFLICLLMIALFIIPNKAVMAKQEESNIAFEEISWEYQRQYSGTTSKYYPGFQFKWKTIPQAEKYIVKIENKEYEFIPEGSKNFDGKYTRFRTLYDSDFDVDFKRDEDDIIKLESQERPFNVSISAFKNNQLLAEESFVAKFPKKAEIEKIEINGETFKNDIKVSQPFEIKIFTNQKANDISALTHIKILKGGYQDINTKLEVHDDYILIKPTEALLSGSNYSLNISNWLMNEDRSQAFLESPGLTLNFNISEMETTELILEKALINDDEAKNLITNPEYKLTSEDTRISLYFNQPVSLENFTKADAYSNGSGIYMYKDGESRYTTESKLTNEEFEIVEKDGKLVSKLSFTMIGKLTYEESLRKPLDSNSKYYITIGKNIYNSNKKGLDKDLVLTINTGELEAKKWTLSTKDAKFISPENNSSDLKIEAGKEVILEAIEKEGFTFKEWQEPYSLKDEFPEIYSDIMTKKKNKRLVFKMPDTDFYIRPIYTEKESEEQEDIQENNPIIDKKINEVQSYIDNYLVNNDIVLIDNNKVPENINALLVNNEYFKIIKSDEVYGMGIDNDGNLYGVVKIDDWKADENSRTIKLKTKVQMTEKFWNVYNINSNTPITDDIKESLLEAKFDLEINILISKNPIQDSENHNENLIKEKIDELDSELSLIEIKENSYFEDKEENNIINLEELNLELISSSHTNGLQISSQGNLIGLADISNWKTDETQRIFPIDLVLKIKDTDITFNYTLNLLMEKSSINRANIIVSDVDPNKLVLFGYIENGLPVFDQESKDWFKSIKDIEVYKDGRWQVLNPKFYTKLDDLFSISFGNIEKGQVFRIKVDSYETIYFESLDPQEHPKDESFPPSAIGLLAEYEIDKKYLTDETVKPEEPETPTQPDEPGEAETPTLPKEPGEAETPTLPKKTNQANKQKLMESPISLTPEIQIFVKGNNDSLTFKSNGEIKALKEVKLNNQLLTKDKYSVKEGSTLVTLNPKFLETLKEGEHVLTLVFENSNKHSAGEVDFRFKVANKNRSNIDLTQNLSKNDKKLNPQTGDNHKTIIFLGMASISILGLYVLSKKKNNV